MIELKKETIARISALAEQEHRTFEGQLLAMSDLYERTYKIKSMQIARPKGRPTKVRVEHPIMQEKKEKSGRGKYKRKPGRVISQETREKISRANKGRPKSEIAKQKLSYAMKLSHAKRRLAKLREAQKSPEMFSLEASPSE